MRVGSEPDEVDLTEFENAAELSELRNLVPTLQRQLRRAKAKTEAVSYTHLTLPTILRV